MSTPDPSSPPPASPRVSVIVRTMHRPLLGEALASLAAQTHRPLEIILVDAAGQGAPAGVTLPDDLRLVTVSTGSRLPRSDAANAGIDAATGTWLMFLDEDDWLAPTHIAGLLARVVNDPGHRAAYSSVAVVALDGTATGTTFAQDYDPVLLRRDNYIPIHAMLFHRSLVDAGCRFDPALPVYEDWDFWLQLSRLTGFAHLRETTAFYRQGGESATATADERARYEAGHPLAQAREQLLNKWRQVWSGRELNELLGRMDDATVQHQLRADIARAETYIGGLEDSLRRELETRRLQQLTIDQLNRFNANLEGQLQAAQAEVTQAREQLRIMQRDHRQERWHLERHVAELQGRLDEIYGSFTWRLIGPLRRSLRWLDRRWVFPLKQRIHFRRHGTHLQAPWLVSEAPHPPALPTAPEPVNPETLKTRHRNQAAARLRDFLQGTDDLILPPTDQPEVSILLVLYNQAPLTLLCLESILQHAPAPYEVVVIDNASSDDSAAMMAKVKNVTYVRNDDNLGFVLAVNQGARLCRGRRLLLLNNDAQLHPGAIEAAQETLDTVPNAGAVGGRILLLDGLLQEAGSCIFADGSCLGYGRHQAPEAPEYMFQRPVDYCSGAFLLFDTQRFLDLGGFDEDYAPAYYEESDFCVRLHQQGLAVIYEPRAVITHFEFASSGGQEKASELQARHREVLVAKHGDFLARQAQPDDANVLRARIANDHLNVLYLDDRVPHATLGAGFPRCREMVRLLSAAPVNLTFYPLQFPDDDWSAIYATLPRDVEVMVGHGVPGLAAFLESRRNHYDFLVVSRVHNMAVLAPLLARDPQLLGRTRLVYDAEAVTAPREILARELRGEVIDAETRERLIGEELSLSRLADTVIAVSEQEAELYHAQGIDNTVVLGHRLRPQPTPGDFSQRNGLLFVGALQVEDSPNVDSLRWFIAEVWPGLRRLLPELTLTVVGDHGAPSLRALHLPGIHWLGRVGDVTPYYDSCRVFIAPTRFAAGIPHKVHEAAAQGVPCVTTSLLARQLGWTPGRELLAADSADAFIAAVHGLYTDASQWQEIRHAALAAVTRDCDPDRFQRTLLGIFGLADAGL